MDTHAQPWTLVDTHAQVDQRKCASVNVGGHWLLSPQVLGSNSRGPHKRVLTAHSDLAGMDARSRDPMA
jgi:hypothetical protein